MARSFTFSADGFAGNATTQVLALFSDATYPLPVRLTNYMPRIIALPSVGLVLKDAGNTAKRTAVAKILNKEALQRLCSDIEAIAEALEVVGALVLTDDVSTPAASIPDVSYPVTFSEKSGPKANNTATGIVGWIRGVVAEALAAFGLSNNTISASVQPRSGLLADLLALDGLKGEWSCPTDVSGCAVLHTGIAGNSDVFVKQGGCSLVVTDEMVGETSTTFSIPRPYSSIKFLTSDSIALQNVELPPVPVGTVITLVNQGSLSVDIGTGDGSYTLGTDSSVAFLRIGDVFRMIAEVVV